MKRRNATAALALALAAATAGAQSTGGPWRLERFTAAGGATPVSSGPFGIRIRPIGVGIVDWSRRRVARLRATKAEIFSGRR